MACWLPDTNKGHLPSDSLVCRLSNEKTYGAEPVPGSGDQCNWFRREYSANGREFLMLRIILECKLGLTCQLLVTAQPTRTSIYPQSRVWKTTWPRKAGVSSVKLRSNQTCLLRVVVTMVGVDGASVGCEILHVGGPLSTTDLDGSIRHFV